MRELITFVFSLTAIIGFAQNPIPQNYPYSVLSNEIDGGTEESGVTTVQFFPVNNVGVVERYRKLELGFRLPKRLEESVKHYIKHNSNGINPYNPDEIEIEATFTSQSGVNSQRFGFYYIPYKIKANSITMDTTSFNWRLRFSPDQVGQWQATIAVKIAGKTVYAQTLSFECIPSSHKGYIQRSWEGNSTDRQLYYSETGETFFGVGGNVCHSTYDHNFTVEENERHKMWLGKLADAGGNFFRLELGPQTALPDWEDIDDYTKKMQQMYLYDEIVDFAHLRELYFIMFRHHTEVLEEWDSNPYVKAFNIPKGSAHAYFEDPTILDYQFKTLKYIFARWGHSPNFAIYEYQEVDRWMRAVGAPNSGEMPVKYNATMRDWFTKNKNEIRNEIKNDRILLTVAYAVLPDYELKKAPFMNYKGVFDQCDLATFHHYGSRPNVNFIGRYTKATKVWKKTDKPFIIEEIGDDANQIPIYCCTDLTFHTDIWSTAMMGGIGCGMSWWWDRGIYLNDYQKQYKHLQLFFQNENLRDLMVTPQKWEKDSHSKKVYLQNYALRSKNKERALGWIQNSSVHWRNLYASNECIKSLVDSNVTDSICVFEDGWRNINSHVTFDDPAYSFGKDGTVHSIGGRKTVGNNPRFRIKSLKLNIIPWAKKHWYKIEFYSTRTINPNSISPDPSYTQILHTNGASRLKPVCPDMNENIGDWAYKVTYLGKFRRAPNSLN